MSNKKFLFLTKFIFFAVSVALLSLSFEKPFFWIFGLVALVPLLFLLDMLKDWKRSFWVGWGLGALFFIISFRWMFSIFPNEAMGISGDIGGLSIIGIFVLVLAAAGGLAFGLFGAFAKSVLKRLNYFSLLFALAGAWVFSEYLRAWILSIVTWGHGATLGPFWTFGNLGYLPADTPFFYFARTGGLYGMSFLVAAINVAIFSALKKRGFSNKSLILASSLVCFVFLSSFFSPLDYVSKVSASGTPVKFLLLGIADDKGPFYRHGFMDLLGKNMITRQNQPDIVVFPEGFPLLSIAGEFEKPVFKKIFPDENKGGFVVANKISNTKKGKVSEIIYRDQDSLLIAKKEKFFLVPGGEIMPFVLKGILAALGLEDKTARFRQSREIAKGSEEAQTVLLGETRVGSFLCSGIVAPDFSRSLVNEGAQIIINSSSHSLWRSHPRIYNELELMARFEAMAHQRPVLQSTRGGPALFIDETGRIVKKTSLEETEFLFAEVYPQDSITPIARFGDAPVVASVFLVILASFAMGSSHRTRRFL